MNFLQKNFGRFGNNCFQLFYIYAQFRDNKLPDIFLQDYRYFDKYKEELQQMFERNEEKDERVSIHVRREDYTGNLFYIDLMETDYYQKAMAEFPNEKFIVFSDDPDWCEKQEIFKDCDISFRNEQEDFSLQAKCKAHIIANSSFSYMAAYLGGDKTIYPKNWYTDGIQRTVCPPDWIGI